MYMFVINKKEHELFYIFTEELSIVTCFLNMNIYLCNEILRQKRESLCAMMEVCTRYVSKKNDEQPLCAHASTFICSYCIKQSIG